ncbi:hypothetical protein L198_01490 [Cryptococcus wingfieldii CBS 7118]|uniref:Shugoshin C-terminal domain-containing protein n=1 Tax=Cryptococcus wingfieldii CBS 7118 TaxID=1295528 RepID=A0A1E3JZD8_9TREE|nr:hypothetical protein L198_01490 [Cryptococcus wingfieldii CBS 7118]ODO06258.1 hypothetical protein L198_01490 [Cryptococcus wingfieldii CBS 7118]
MSTRQGRRSLGLPPLNPQTLENKKEPGFVEQQKFDDFRRRHREQNREVIITNVEHKRLIKSLQDEITLLQNELLDVRREKLTVQAKVNKMERDNLRLRTPEVMRLLDILLQAAPALVNLRQTIAKLPTPPTNTAPSFAQPIMPFVGNPTATRPAASGKDRQGLGCWAEEEEGDWAEERRVTSRSRGRQTDVGSIAASRSPQRKAYPLSPARRSLSPSPKKASAIRLPIVPKRRRESGLLPPRPRSLSPEAVQTREEQPLEEPEEAAVEAVVAEEEGIEDEWEEGPVVEMKPDEALALVEEEDENEEDAGLPARKEQEQEKEKEKEKTPAQAGEGETADITVAWGPSRLSTSSTEHVEAETAGRSRRARGSVVSYKEPSLNKKMRKPDGVQTEDAIKTLGNRHSVTPKKATPKKGKRDTRRLSSPVPMPDFSDRPSASSSASSRSASISSSQGMRRKSMLPKSNMGKGKARDDNQERVPSRSREELSDDYLDEYEAEANNDGDDLHQKFGKSLHIGSSSSSQSLASSAPSRHPDFETSKSRTRPTAQISSISLQPAPLNQHSPDHPSSIIASSGIGSRPSSVTARRPMNARSFTPTSATRPRDVLGEVGDNVEAKAAMAKEAKARAVAGRRASALQ